MIMRIARPCQSFSIAVRHSHGPFLASSCSTRHDRVEPIVRLLANCPRDENKQPEGNNAALDWESFEFGPTPKWDKRFDGEISMIADVSTHRVQSKETALKELYQSEAIQDKVFAKKLNTLQAAWQQLNPALVEKGISVLRPYVQPERVERIQHVLRQRTARTRFLFENPSNPSNVWACLRTIEAFGIQHVDIVMESAKFTGKAGLSQKRGMRTAVGSAQWLSLTQYSDTATAIQTLNRTHRIFASDLQTGSRDIRELPWNNAEEDNDDDRPICIVMGNEEEGISDAMRNAADERFRLPMVGFAESFNLSVATAITLAHLSAASGPDGKGPLRPGDLPESEIRCLLLKGLYQSVAQRRVAESLLRQTGLDLPQAIMSLI